MRHQYFVYIMTNDRHTVLYTGVTNDLLRRVGEHRAKLRSRLHSLATTRTNWCTMRKSSDANAAIAREKQIKGGSRRRKVALIDSINPDWRDLFDDLV